LLKRHRRAVIFLGPSAPISEAIKVLPSATFLPPAGRGDIVSATDGGFEIIGLIDGVFYQRNAVAHREIKYAIERGVVVVADQAWAH